MAQPFKFRYVNQIVGTFVLLTSLLVVGTAVMVGFSQRWFSSVETLTLKIPGGLSTDLRPGTDVVIGGTVAGSVQSAVPDPADPSATIAILSMPRTFRASVHRDSKVEILRSLGGVGDPYVKITGGTGAPMTPGGSIAIEAANIRPSPTEMAQKALGDIRDAAVHSLHNIDVAVENLNKSVEDYNDKQGDVQQAIAHTNSIIASIDRGQSLAGKLLKDEKFANQISELTPKATETLDALNGALKDVQKTTSQLPQFMTGLNKDMDQMPQMLADLHGTIARTNLVLADLQKTTANLPRTTTALNQTMESLPGLVLQTQETLRQMQKLMEAAQRSWVLRPLIDQDAPPDARTSGGKVSP